MYKRQAFFGVGAYTAAILSTRIGLTFIQTAILGTIVAAVFGILLGIPTLRIKGRYLAIVTLGFCEIMRIIELNWMSLTRGPQGISGIPKISAFGFVCSKPIHKYYVALILLVITVLFIKAIMNSRMGRAISAIRDDETAADAMGINVFKYKLMVFAISSGLAGLIGAFYAHYMGFIDPNAFNFDPVSYTHLDVYKRQTGLTSITHPKEELGKKSAEKLLSIINGEKVSGEIMDVDIVVRNSTRKL